MKIFQALCASLLLYASAFAGVTVTSPTAEATLPNAVRITASASESTSFHLEIWDNGLKLGNVFAAGVDNVYVLPTGSHVMTVESVSSLGKLLSSQSVVYKVARSCTNSPTTQCNLELTGIDNVQNLCSPTYESAWIANACGDGVQGYGGSFPLATGIALVTESGQIRNQNNLTLDGTSLHLSEVQGDLGYSNVLFRGQTPTKFAEPQIDSHWTMDEYVYIPDPTAHQALELDAQATIGGVWSKFYTECAFNMGLGGTGFWQVFDSETGGWIVLNGQQQNGQTPPIVPCTRAQFSLPWSGSSNPNFTGWHQIAWTFHREIDGTVTFETLTFDATTTQIHFHPNSGTGGVAGDTGNFGALVQLDGVQDIDRMHDNVDVYVEGLTLTHTP